MDGSSVRVPGDATGDAVPLAKLSQPASRRRRGRRDGMTVPNLLHRIKRKKRPGKKGNREREIACRMAGCAMSLATYKCAFQDFHALLSAGKNSRKAGHKGKAPPSERPKTATARRRA